MTCFLTWSPSFNPAILKVWPSDLWKSEIFSGVLMLKTIFFVNDTFFVIFFWVHKTQLTSQAESRGWQETFPSQPVVRPIHFYCQGLGSIPGGETKMPQAAWQGQKKKKKRVIQICPVGLCTDATHSQFGTLFLFCIGNILDEVVKSTNFINFNPEYRSSNIMQEEMGRTCLLLLNTTSRTVVLKKST